MSPSLHDISIQADRRSAVSIYLLCRILIEVYNQTTLASLTPQLAAKLEDIIFAQLKQMDRDQLASPFQRANFCIYCQLLGVMGGMNLQSVTQRFISELRSHQKEVTIKGGPSKDIEDRLVLIIYATRYLRLKIQPEPAWKESTDFLVVLADLFLNCHGQNIKYAYCEALSDLLFPIASSVSPYVNTPRWKEFLTAVNSRLSSMLSKPRHWAHASGLSTLILCASPVEVFAAQWFSVVTSMQGKLKDRASRAFALQSICRLMWTYLDRVNEPVGSKIRKIEDVMKMVLPTGKKGYLSIEPTFADTKVEMIRIIGYRYPEFCFTKLVFPLIHADLFTQAKELRPDQLDPERMVIGIRAFLAIISDLEKVGDGRPPFPRFATAEPPTDYSSFESLNQDSKTSPKSNQDEQSLSPVATACLDDATRKHYTRFCEILGKITLFCDSTFGGQAVLDEKFAGVTPKTPMSDTFSFVRKDDHLAMSDQRQGFYDLLHVAVQALPRCLSAHISLNPLINLMCTGTAHVRSSIAVSSAQSLKSIARQGHAQPVTIGFARFILKFDTQYATMSDEGMLGPGHIENTLHLYVELLQIWIEDIKQKSKSVANGHLEESPSGNRSVPLDLTNVTSLVDEVEAHGIFFLCSQSRRVRSYAVRVLRLITEFDTALGHGHPRIIHLLEGDTLKVMDINDEQLSVAERSRLQKGKRKSMSQSTMVELCSSDVSYDSTLWFKIFPNLVRISCETCLNAMTVGNGIVCARLQQMQDTIAHLASSVRGPPVTASDGNPLRNLTRLGTTSPDIIIEQWKLYLIMACTTMKDAGAQTQSQLANAQHARKISQKSAQEKALTTSSGRQLFASVIPLLSAARGTIRDAIVIALGSINIALYRTLLESLQYAVTTCKEDAKLRIGKHQRTGSSPRRNRKTDLLRTEVTHVYRLTSRFLRDSAVLQDEWILNNLSTYTKDLMIFLSDAEIQNDWECQRLRRHYCGLLEELYEGIRRTQDSSRWMAFESRKSSFALMEDWCGYSPNQSRISQREDNMRQNILDQHQDTGERTNVTAAIEIEKRNLKTAALSAMAALCAGPIRIYNKKGDHLAFDVRRMLSWIDQIFENSNDKIHLIGRRALENLITHNRDYPYLLEHSIEKCYAPDKPQALESYFQVATKVLMEYDDYPVAFWRILGTVLFTLGSDKSHIRMKSAKLLRTLEQRQQKSSKLQDFDISISDRTAAVYKLAQFEVSRRLAKQHGELAFFIFSQFSVHFKKISSDSQRNMIAAILPWIQTVELQLDPGGGPTAQSYMLLANLLEITTKVSSTLHNEVQALWQALATGPHGGNVQLVLDFVISLCLDRREQSFVDYAKQIVVYLSSTPAGEKVVEFLLLQITPKNMVQEKREPIVIPPDALGLPYVADLSEALPIGTRQSGFSMGQLSLIFLVDLMVAPVTLDKDSVPLLLQVILVLWDHYTLLVQEQSREMLVHLIHELVIAKIEDNTTTPNKGMIEALVESIRQHEPNVVWSYEDCNGKDDDEEGLRVPTAMTYVTQELVELFAIAYPKFHDQWAKVTLSWATSCPVRHIACRSFQIFRCILSAVDHAMLADMLLRLSNTIADEEPDIQNFSMEILTTLKTIIGALEPRDLLKFPQLFWATCVCLDTRYEREFVETLAMLAKFLEKVDLSDPAVVKILNDKRPDTWHGTFEGIAPLIYKGFKSASSLDKSLSIMDKLVALPDNDLVGNRTKLLFGVFANLPRFLKSLENGSRDPICFHSAQVLAAVAETQEHQEISIVLNAFANNRYTTAKELLAQVLSTLRRTFFPAWELKTLIFLIGLLTNPLPWFRLKVLEILSALLAHIDTRRTEIASQGPDLISPLLRLSTTEYCPQALRVMDFFMVMSTTPMDTHHMRMSMASSGSRSIRKEYEKTQSLYGIPEDTGWSIPMPAVHSSTTRANMQAVFYTCNQSTSNAAATPEVEFHTEEYNQGSYFSLERSDTLTSEDPRAEITSETGMGDLVSKLDSLDDFFEDSLMSENGTTRPYSTLTITGFKPDADGQADLYDQQTAPILRKLSRTASVTSLQNGFSEHHSSSSRDPVMSPAAFAPNPTPTSTQANPLPVRPPLHVRSVTTPANNLPKMAGSELASEDEADVFSEDERATGHGGSRMLGSGLRAVQNDLKKFQPGISGKEYRQRDLLRGQSRSRSQAPDSPDVPKVPEAYLRENIKPADV